MGKRRLASIDRAACACAAESQPGGGGLHSTACTWRSLSAGGVGKVEFTLLGLEPGEHTLTFTLKTKGGGRDVLEKKLRVVPEGVKKEVFSGGTLDPQGLYGSEKRVVELRNKLPTNIVPNTAVERMITINGEVLGEVLSVMHSPEGLRQLINLPAGSEQPALGGAGRRHREELCGPEEDHQRGLTALVVRTLSLVDPVVSVDHQTLSESISWLIRDQQQQDGSFRDPSSVRPNRVMAAGTPALDRSFHDDSMRSAVNYITQHAPGVKSVYVRAVATFALTLRDASSPIASELMISLEKLARDKGHPAELRYWQEASVAADWLKPDESSGLTVETTAYVLLTVLLKGRIPYANPILAWLTQDQHYGEGFYSDTVLTLESLTEYSRVIPRAVLDQDINVRYGRKGPLGRVHLSQSRPVATPIQVTKEDTITVSTGYGKGVSNVKLKTVYYETTPPAQNCNFHLTIEAVGPNNSTNAGMTAPHLVACAKYKPPPNELFTESSLTVMKIQLPTGVEAFLEDLRQFRDSQEPSISHFELQGNTVIIQADSVPSEEFLCVGFRIRTGFRVGGASESLFSVYEPQDKGSECTRQFSYQQQKLQRLCVDEKCQCMTAACAAYRGNMDPTLTVNKPYRVTVKSSAAEGDFMSYTATVEEVLKNTDRQLEAVSSGSDVELVKKVTCSSVDLQDNKQYLVMGASGSEVTLSRGFRYRLPVDSEALVDLWPKVCSSPECTDYISHLEDFALDLQLSGCPNSS
ncbi:Complement C5 [Dissostichus eleginoides]|uniref:Complement C5 n=1 Tax=Dissostichus eleginoides TaxID=100907 RepID=A0AAD9BZF9_DISEL|nr:Complement C5 [Dissostichus eleginoides]